MGAVIAPNSRMEPISMKAAGFNAGLLEASDDTPISLVIAVEDQSMLRTEYLEKLSMPLKELDERRKELESRGLKYSGEDSVRIKFVEERPSNWKCYLVDYHGPYGPVKKFIYGEYQDDGQVIRTISYPHPRCWVTGVGSFDSDTVGLQIESNKDKIESVYKARFKLVEWKSWAEVMAKFH